MSETMVNNEDQCSIRILSYNMFIRPPGITTHGNDYKNERLRYFFENIINDYDVICLQEIFGTFSNRRQMLITEAKNRGFDYHLYSVKPPFNFCGDFFVVDGGLLILSRFPIEACNRLVFQKGKNNDSFAAKGVIHTRIKLNNIIGSIDVYNLHLQSMDKHEKERLYQLDLFRMFFKTTHNPTSIAFVSGDFNMNGKNESTYLKLLNKMKFQGMVTIDNIRAVYSNYDNICTYGDPYSTNTCLIDQEDSKLNEVLDYIWTIIPIDGSNVTPRECINIMLEKNVPAQENDTYVVNKVGINKFSVNKVYKNLSDHYGVYLEVTIKNPEFKLY